VVAASQSRGFADVVARKPRPSTPRTIDLNDVPARERILAAVIAGLTELDPAALTIQQICDRAEVSPPTIYYHFGSKDGLTAAAVETLVTQWISQLDSAIDRQGDLEATMQQTLAAWKEMITATQRPFAVFVWVAMWSEESRAALVRARQHAYRLIREALVDHLGDEVDSGELADLLLDGVLGAAVTYQLDADDEALQRRLISLVSTVHTRIITGTTDKEHH